MPRSIPSGGGSPYDYVDDTEPSDPEETEIWYDTSSGEEHVYDGTEWVRTTYTDTEIQNAVDGSSLSELSIGDSFTDPSGTQHTGEIADLADVPTGSTGTASSATALGRGTWSTSDAQLVSNNKTPVGAKASEVYFDQTQTDADQTAYALARDGTVYSATIPNRNDLWLSTNGDWIVHVWSTSDYGDNVYWRGINPVVAGSHSHSL